MRLTFQSLCSSSAGNCLLLSSNRTTILIDCGFASQRACREMLQRYAGRIEGVLVSHAHGDHIGYSALKVLQEFGSGVYCHDDVRDEVEARHVRKLNSPIRLSALRESETEVGDFSVSAVRLPHAPGCPTFGFVIRYGESKLVFCTDFNDPASIADHLVDANFIFIESNHDLALLKKFPNFGSHYHLSNFKAAGLLCEMRKRSKRPPEHVMLGHLSEERNSDRLALNTIRTAIAAGGLDLDFQLSVAPRRTASEMLAVC